MPVEFVHDVSDAKDAYKLIMAYDGAGRRISKTRMKKTAFDGPWYASLVTHYTGIGTEIRENPVSNEAKVVIDSFDNDEIETKIPYSLLESVLQSVDSVYLSPLGQCNCDCAGGDLSFYLSKKENASASFYTNIGLSHICSPINQNTELVLRVKDKHKIKAIADTLMSIKGK